MGASKGQKLSGMQRQVLSLYRGFLRAARSKPTEDRRQIESIVSAEFRQNSKQVDRKNFLYIEYLLRRGKKQLDQLKSPDTIGLSSCNGYWVVKVSQLKDSCAEVEGKGGDCRHRQRIENECSSDVGLAAESVACREEMRGRNQKYCLPLFNNTAVIMESDEKNTKTAWRCWNILEDGDDDDVDDCI
ncbi:hypothetical protein Goarm_000843 [Gossypium armourianum]|uniref:Complex 1 LYR protein domain-containing protein n=1 Tax=Gossypium armourianum TaxID=34283 RepID=A0A7J9KB42_9ROSI|nr:hypothetical protein [Gossypium armourianum]